ncbi:SHOCT domain-containing protein [Lysinibacillus sp. RC79]|uniref:SHOCT domain-containing protein n=1 Tax=Lysinibacillus sp. RC79 TaxID=3156296 RepID=UPI003511E33D
MKCDKKDLEKLSLLIVAEEEETTQSTVTPSSVTAVPTDDLIKLKELMDVGVLTQEEFEAKKKTTIRNIKCKTTQLRVVFFIKN